MVAEAMNCAFQLPPDGVPRELHKQSPSDTMDDRQKPSAIWTRHSTLLTLIQRSRKGLLSNHLGCPTSGISLCRGGGRFVLASQQDWKYWQRYPGMQFSSVNLKFHEPCVNIYACLPSPYALQLGKFTCIIFLSSLPIFHCPHYPSTSMKQTFLKKKKGCQIHLSKWNTLLVPPPHTSCHYHSIQFSSTQSRLTPIQSRRHILWKLKKASEQTGSTGQQLCCLLQYPRPVANSEVSLLVRSL